MNLRHQKYKNKQLKNSTLELDKLEKIELTKKKTFTKNTSWYDLLINYILEPIKKTVGGVKDQIMSLFKTKIMVEQNVSKPCMEVERNQAN